MRPRLSELPGMARGAPPPTHCSLLMHADVSMVHIMVPAACASRDCHVAVTPSGVSSALETPLEFACSKLKAGLHLQLADLGTNIGVFGSISCVDHRRPSRVSLSRPTAARPPARAPGAAAAASLRACMRTRAPQDGELADSTPQENAQAAECFNAGCGSGYECAVARRWLFPCWKPPGGR
eukprot:364843-Chlamydomonas_euryale.AAC.9